MPPASVDFDAPDLAAQIEKLSESERDLLPFGVILLDREGIVRFYSKTEARQSGYSGPSVGVNFFTIAERPSKTELHNRIMRAMEEGPVDLEFGWKGDYSDRNRELRIRVLSAKSGGVWMFLQR